MFESCCPDYLKKMIQNETLLNVSDNSGISIVKSIKSLGGSLKKWSSIGDYIVVSVRKVDDKSKLKKKVYLAFIIGTKKMYRRKLGHYIKFGQNRVILLQDKDKILGNRIFGPVPSELRKVNLPKLTSLVKTFI